MQRESEEAEKKKKKQATSWMWICLHALENLGVLNYFFSDSVVQKGFWGLSQGL